MRKLLLVTLGAASVSVALFAGVGGASDGGYESAMGAAERSATTNLGDRHVAFNAVNGPRGTSGEFTSHRQLAPGLGPGPLLTFTGDVTCLLVDGNRAVIGGIIRQSLLAETEGTMFFAAVEDNGTPASGSLPDQVSAYFINVPGVDACEEAAPGLFPSLAPVESGNVRVSG